VEGKGAFHLLNYIALSDLQSLSIHNIFIAMINSYEHFAKAIYIRSINMIIIINLRLDRLCFLEKTK
jgi:hypothetical protein